MKTDEIIEKLQDFWEWYKNGILSMLTLAAFMLAIVAVFAHLIQKEIDVERPKQYAAWCKQTGNENKLTFEEWKDYMKSTRNQGDSTVIFVRH